MVFTLGIRNILTSQLKRRSSSVTTLIRKISRKMRVVRFEANGRRGLGVELSESGDVVDVTSFDPSVTADTRAFIEGGERSLAKAKA